MPTKAQHNYIVEIQTGVRPSRWERCSAAMTREAAAMYAKLWMTHTPHWKYRARRLKVDDAD